MLTTEIWELGVLNLQDFNRALLKNLWWKFCTNQKGCWPKGINFNYLRHGSSWPLHHSPPNKESFLWASIAPLLPIFHTCSSMVIKDGASTSLWFNPWVNALAPKDIWQTHSKDCTTPRSLSRASLKLSPLR